MKDGITTKATSTEDLHKIVVEMIALANGYMEKYPTFDISIEVSHKDLEASFKLAKNE